MRRTRWFGPVLAMLLVAVMAAACGGDDAKPAPTAVAATAAASVVAPATTPTAVATSAAGVTPTAVATSAAAATPTVVTATGCPAGWSLQNVPARSYHFCLPPGWTAQLVSAATAVVTPVPSGGSLASEPVGSLVLALSPEQGSNTTPGAVNNGTLIRIYMTSIQISFGLPGAPLCSGAAGGVAGRAVSICSLDNTSAATNPYRLQEWFSQPANPTISIQAFVGKDVPASGSMLAAQIVGTIAFN